MRFVVRFLTPCIVALLSFFQVQLCHAGLGDQVGVFNNPSPATGEQFGVSLAVLGGNVLVGTPHDEAGGSVAGRAYYFDGSTGLLLSPLDNPTPQFGDAFGTSVLAVNGNIAVGAPSDNTGAKNSGAAYLFSGMTGGLLKTYNNPTDATDDSFGLSVSGAGVNVLIGAWGDDAGALNAGQRISSTPTWPILLLAAS